MYYAAQWSDLTGREDRPAVLRQYVRFLLQETGRPCWPNQGRVLCGTQAANTLMQRVPQHSVRFDTEGHMFKFYAAPFHLVLLAPSLSEHL
jgi:hypothetical protein